MLELYHWEPDAETAKALIALEDKAIEWAGRYVDVMVLEQYSPAIRALSPNGRLPILLHDDAVIVGANFIVQYLTEAFPTPQFEPGNAKEWYDLQAWIKLVDATLGPPVALLGWHSSSTPKMREDYRRQLAEAPGRERLAGWASVVSDAEATEDRLDNARQRVTEVVARLEEALEATNFLIGAGYTVADGYAFAATHTLPRLLPGQVNAKDTPRIMAWLARIAQRPPVRRALQIRRSSKGSDPYPPV